MVGRENSCCRASGIVGLGLFFFLNPHHSEAISSACRPCGPSLRSQSPWSQDRPPALPPAHLPGIFSSTDPACSPEWRLSLCVPISCGCVHLCFSIAEGPPGCRFTQGSPMPCLPLRSHHAGPQEWCFGCSKTDRMPLSLPCPSL